MDGKEDFEDEEVTVIGSLQEENQKGKAGNEQEAVFGRRGI